MSQIKQKKIPDLLFCFGIVFMFLTYDWVEPTHMANEIKVWQKIFGVISLCLLSFRIILTSQSKPLILLSYFCLLFFGFCHYSLTGITDLLFLIAAVFSAINVRKRSIIGIYWCCFILVILSGVVLYLLGESQDVLTHEYGIVGHSWGLSNPNTLGTILFMLVVATILYFNIQRTYAIIIICWVLSIVAILVTLCKTTAILLFLFPFILLFVKNKGRRYDSKFYALLPFGGLFLSVLLSAYFGASQGATTFESRFSIPWLLYAQNGLNYLGCSQLTLPVDNAFWNVFFRYGCFLGVLVLIFDSHNLFKIARTNDYILITASVCLFLLGFMERCPMTIYYNFLFCYYLNLGDEEMVICRNVALKKKMINVGWTTLFISGLALLVYVYFPWSVKFIKKPSTFCISDIEALPGYNRVDSNTEFANYLRSLPLRDKSYRVRTYFGQPADSINLYTYRVVDLPILSNYEQCADVCMHIRADYLFKSRRFFEIHFKDTQNNTIRFNWGARKQKFKEYLCELYKVANTESLIGEMQKRKISKIDIGDLFVYDYKSRPGAKYGHAMMVVDLAINNQTGERMIMLAQGSTPACDIHILANTVEPELSPWFRIEENDTLFNFGFAKYYANELFLFEK